MKHNRYILFAVLFTLTLGIEAHASLKVKAGYEMGMGSDNAGSIGVWSNYKGVPTTDGAVLGKSPSGVSASVAMEGLLLGTRFTFDQTSTGSKSGDLAFSKISSGTITTTLTTMQYG